MAFIVTKMEITKMTCGRRSSTKGIARITSEKSKKNREQLTFVKSKVQNLIPVNSLNAVGTLLLCVIQKTSAFFVIYNPGSIITGFAL